MSRRVARIECQSTLAEFSCLLPEGHEGYHRGLGGKLWSSRAGRPAKALADVAHEPGRTAGRQLHLRVPAALALELEREAVERGLPLSVLCLLRLRGEPPPRR